MSYPWYSTGNIIAGHNRQAAIYTDRHCDTKQIRYRFEWIVPVGNGKKSVSDTDVEKLRDKAQAALVKYTPRNPEHVAADMREVFEALQA